MILLPWRAQFRAGQDLPFGDKVETKQLEKKYLFFPLEERKDLLEEYSKKNP